MVTDQTERGLMPVVALLLILLTGVVVWLRVGPSAFSDEAGWSSERAGSEQRVQPSGDPANAYGESVRVPVPAHSMNAGIAAVWPGARIDGLVVDASHGGGVSARLYSGQQLIGGSSPSGRLSLALPGTRSSFVLRADGYSDHPLPEGGLSDPEGIIQLGVVRMDPAQFLKVSVQATRGSAAFGIAGAELSLTNNKHRLGRVAIRPMTQSISGPSGVVDLPISGPSRLRVELPTGVTFERTVDVGEHVEIEVETGLRPVFLLSSLDGSPCEGITVSTVEPSAQGPETSQYTARTGSNGVVLLPLGAGQQRVDFGVLHAVNRVIERGHAVHFAMSRAGSLRIDLEHSSEPLEVYIDPGYLRLRFLDDQDSQPIEGSLTWGFEWFSARTGMWHGSKRWYRDKLINGALIVPGGLEDLHDVESVAECRFTFWVNGFYPHHLSRVRGVGSDLEITLKRAPQRRVSVKFADGTPYQERVSLLGGQRSWPMTGNGVIPDANGIVGPYDWIGEDWRVSTLRGAELGLIPAETLQSNPITDLLLPGAGEIHLKLAPRSAPAPALQGVAEDSSSLHAEWDPSREQWNYVRVPEGLYLLGPDDWVASLIPRIRQSRYGKNWSAFAGACTIVDQVATPISANWDARWSSVNSVTGSVQLPGGLPSRLGLLPIYHTLKGPVFLWRGARFLPVDSNGGYRLHRGAPVPEALVVCQFQGGTRDWHSNPTVLEVVPFGSDDVVRTRTVEVSLDSSSSWRPKTYRPVTDSLDFSVPVQLVHEAPVIEWPEGEPAILRGLPWPTNSIVLNSSDGKSLKVALGSEDWIKIALD